MMFEIRNYHFEPTLLDEYKDWARVRALPYLKKNLDVVGFWVNSDVKPEISGTPQDDLGSANVTWIIRWNDRSQREKVFGNVFSSLEWQAIYEKVPGGHASYLRTESRMTTALV